MEELVEKPAAVAAEVAGSVVAEVPTPLPVHDFLLESLDSFSNECCVVTIRGSLRPQRTRNSKQQEGVLDCFLLDRGLRIAMEDAVVEVLEAVVVESDRDGVGLALQLFN